MNIACLVKASLNLNLIKVESDGLVNIEETPLAISEYDKNALEESIRIKEKYGGKVTVFSALTWGPIQKKLQDFERIVRECLAIGADEAHVLIDERLIGATNFEISIAISELIKKVGNFDLFLLGEGSMDISSYQLSCRLGKILDLPVITFGRKIEIDDKRVIVYRDLENEIQVVECNIPCIISVTGEINQPRLPTLRQILQSKTKPLIKHNLDELNLKLEKLPIKSDIRIVPVKRKNIILEGNLEEIADVLINKLIEEGVLKV